MQTLAPRVTPIPTPRPWATALVLVAALVPAAWFVRFVGKQSSKPAKPLVAAPAPHVD